MSQPSVFVVGGDGSIERMFTAYGWRVAKNMLSANLFQFTGGADVTPALYGEASHPTTYNNFARDIDEAGYFAIAQRMDIPMAGICRGGQFLNVMNGGKMWQNVDGHAIRGTHTAWECSTGRELQVTSTHHQMMIEGEGGEAVLIANQSTFKESDKSKLNIIVESDLECVHYAGTKSLCFQPHPEYVQPGHECADYYFELLDRFFSLKA